MGWSLPSGSAFGGHDRAGLATLLSPLPREPLDLQRDNGWGDRPRSSKARRVTGSVTRNPSPSPDVGAACRAPRRPAWRLGRPVARPAGGRQRSGRAERVGLTRRARAGGAGGGEEAAPRRRAQSLAGPRGGGGVSGGGGPARLGVRAPGRLPGLAPPRPWLPASGCSARAGLSGLVRRAGDGGGGAAAQPRSSCPAAASCVRAACPAGPLNKSCARGPAQRRAQRPLQPEGPHARGPRPSATAAAGAARGRPATHPRLGCGVDAEGRADAPRAPPARLPSGEGDPRAWHWRARPRAGAAQWARLGPLTLSRALGLRDPSVPHQGIN